MSFNINFEEYTDSYLTEEEKSKYVRINKANQLLDCFYSLPTQIEKFGVRIDGSLTSYNKEKNTTSTVDINGSSAAVNLLDKTTDEDGNEVLLPDVYGTLYLHHQDLNHIFNSSKTSTKTQKVEFKYDSLSDGSDAQILAEYNDNMHIFLAKSDVVDIYKQIDGIEDGNLLLRYLGVLNGTVKGLPIIDMIKNRDFASLLRFKCIKRIQIDDANEGDGRITLIISPEIIGNHDDKEDFYIYIDYNSNGLTKASISKVIDSSSSKKTISATIQFANFEDIANPDMLSYSGNESKFLNMEGFKTLVRCLIDTTEYNYFHLSGNLKLTVSLSSTISCDCLAKIYVADDTAYAYISIITGDAKSITSDNFYATEFFIKEKEVMVCQTKTDEYTSWFTGYRKTTSEVFKITQSEMISNIVYYLFDYTMDLGSLKTALVVKTGNIILQKIYDSQYGSGSDTNLISFNENNDFSQVIDSATPTFSSDGSGSFDMTLNLNNLISITLMSFSSTTIHVTYTKPVKFNGKDNKHLNYISLSTSIGLGSGDSLISADLSFSASVAGIDHIDDAKAKTNMARYYSFVSAFENEYGVFSDNSKLGLYATEWYQDGSDWKVRSNSNRIMRTYDVKKDNYNINSRSDRIFFYNT
jgi:hypothetical protein